MEKLNVAVVGATEFAGRAFIKVLEQRRFPVASIRLFATEHSPGKELFFDHQRIQIEEIVPDAFKDTDVVFFFAGADVSRRLVPLAVGAGAVVIDNSAAFSSEAGVPLVVPEVNLGDIEWHKGIIANPSCPAIQLAVTLNPLHKVIPVKRVVLSTYQSVSGSGAAAMKELTNQTRLVLDGYRVCPHVYAHQIAFNVLPEIGLFLDSGYTREEQRIADETCKILHVDKIAMSATCVRVPVYFGDSASVHIEFESSMSPDKVRRLLAEAPGLRIIDDCSVSLYPQPWAISGSNLILIGRIRKDLSLPNGVVLWVVADNIHKCTALNAVLILEEGVHKGWINKTSKTQEVLK